MHKHPSYFAGGVCLGIALILATGVPSLAQAGIAAQTQPRTCVELLSADLQTKTTAAVALAQAWSEVLSRDREYTASELDWLTQLASAQSPSLPALFHISASLFEFPVRQGLEVLEELTGLVITQQRAGEAEIVMAIQEQARIILATRRRRDERDRTVTDERRNDVRLAPPEIFETAGPIWASPVQLKGGTIVLTARGGLLHFLSPELREIRRLNLGAGIYADPLELTSGNVAVASNDGVLHILTPHGDRIREIPVGGNIYAPLAQLSNGLIVISNDTYPDSATYFLQEDGTQVGKIASARGIGVRTAAVELAGGHVLIAGFDREGTVTLATLEGHQIRTISLGAASNSTPRQISNGLIVVGDNNGVIHFFRPDLLEASRIKAGDRVWTRPVELPDGRVLIGSMDKFLYFATPDGTLLHSVPAENALQSPPLVIAPRTGTNSAPNRILLATSNEDGFLRVFSSEGTLLMRYPTGARGDFMPSATQLADGRIAMAAPDGKVHFIRIDYELLINR